MSHESAVAEIVRNSEPDLPMGWVWTTLGEIAHVNRRDTALRDLPDSLLVSFVPMAAVDAERGTIAWQEERRLSEVRKGFTSFSDGDVLFAKITPCMENGKAAVAHGLKNERGFGSTEFHVLTPRDGVSARWIFYFVRQQSFREDTKARFTGTAGQLRVPGSFLVNYPIALGKRLRGDIRDEVPGACFQNTLVRFCPFPGVLPECALSVFRAYLHSGRFRRIARWTTNIAHLGAGRFSQIEFPLPPLFEQEQIVAEVESRLSVVNKLEAQIEAELKRAERLRQSILRQAFAGKLVPQDPEDEPAGVLLERILSQRRARADTSQSEKAVQLRLV